MPRQPASHDVLTVPNVISTVRLVVAIGVFVLLAAEQWGWSCAAFLIAASTDAIDGWYARRYTAISVLGRVLDPLVDKVLVCGCYIMLAAGPAPDGASSIAAWMAVVVVVRELVVTGVRGEMERQGVDFSATLSGKLKMILQSAAVTCELVNRGGIAVGIDTSLAAVMPTVARALSWLAIALTIESGLEYLWAARSVLTGRRST